MNAEKGPQDSYVEVFDGGVAMVGEDAILLFRAITLRSALGLYLKIGMLPSRNITPAKMLALTTTITKQPYTGNGKYDRALEDLTKWIDTMKAAMPVYEEGKQVS